MPSVCRCHILCRQKPHFVQKGMGQSRLLQDRPFSLIRPSPGQLVCLLWSSATSPEV